jgi:hypothetical protein
MRYRAGVSCPYKNSWFSRKDRQLDGAVHPGASRIALGRIQHRVSGKEKPARIEVRSRQTEASRLRKPLARLTTEGVTDM